MALRAAAAKKRPRTERAATSRMTARGEANCVEAPSLEGVGRGNKASDADRQRKEVSAIVNLFITCRSVEAAISWVVPDGYVDDENTANAKSMIVDVCILSKVTSSHPSSGSKMLVSGRATTYSYNWSGNPHS